jgi:hypothetical protein
MAYIFQVMAKGIAGAISSIVRRELAKAGGAIAGGTASLYNKVRAAVQKTKTTSASAEIVKGADQFYNTVSKAATSASPVSSLQKVDPFESVSMITPDSIGKMFCFSYDPKTKDKLPYYDKFPLIFPINFYSDGFLGINLHYLPPMLRAKLMDALYDIAVEDKYNNSKKLKISYDLLNSSSKYKYFRPCVKRYLSSHVRSKFVAIDYENWDMVLMLPMQRFEKASDQKVWKDSIDSVRG